MFGTYLKTSLWVLPWFLIPGFMYVFFIMGIDPYYIQLYGEATHVVGGLWGLFARESVFVSLIASIVVNIVLLLIVPALIGGANANIKHTEFFVGFFVNIAVMLAMPLYFFLTFGLDSKTFGILIAMHTIMFLVTYIVASRFVSPVYKRAFWFTIN
ncbi:hypothetical protein FACS1894161_5140 [Spirochaetia bacterium]|nr:hypothetical protein FACS1894161_5140 [Spirochaetia bacterium]